MTQAATIRGIAPALRGGAMAVASAGWSRTAACSTLVLLAAGGLAPALCGGAMAMVTACGGGERAAGSQPSASAGAGATFAGAGNRGAPGDAAVGPAGNGSFAGGAGAGAPGGGGTPAGGTGAGAASGRGASDGAGQGGAAGAAGVGAAIHCSGRAVTGGDALLHMHHVHFNTQDPDGSIAFAQKFFGAQPIDFCTDESSSRTTRAVATERAYFLYTRIPGPPSDMRLTRLAHVGFNSTDVAAELDRLLALDVPLADASVCATAAQGTPCNTFDVQWFYVETAEGARFEVASGPGPSTSGFAHIHLVAPTWSFFEDVLGDALASSAGTRHVDGVNAIDSGRSGVLDPSITYQDTRGSALDHVGYSTTDLEGTLARIEAAGVAVEEPISFKDEHGFRSFFVRSPEGVWLEIVEDAPFAR